MIDATESLTQHQLVILRRLRKSPLTEFELVREVAEHSGYTMEQCEDNMRSWLEELKEVGLIWCGTLSNAAGQEIMAAALTSRGVELVG